MKLIKYFLCIALAVSMFISAAGTVAAADLSGFNAERDSSISITLAEGGDAVVGAQVSIYKVANLSVDSNGYSCSYLEEFINCGIAIDDPQDRDRAEEMYSYVYYNGISPVDTQVSDKNGYVYFGGLKPGVYLIAQINKVTGFTAFSPFMTYLPTTDNNGWVYSIDATPKIDISSEETPPPPPPPPPETTVTTTPTIPTPPPTFPVTTVTTTVTTPVETTPEVTTEEETTTEEEEEEDVPSETEPTVTTAPTTPEEPSNPFRDDDSNAGANGDRFRDDDANAGASGDRLVQTGQLNWPIPILAGSGSAFIAVGAVMRGIGRKRDDDDE